MIKKKIFMKLAVLVFAVTFLAFCSVAVYAAPASGSSGNSTTSSASSSKTKDKNIVKDILCSVGIGVLGGGISVGVVFFRYKTNGRSEPYPYNKKAPLSLTSSEDVHIDTKLEKHKIEKQNN